MDSSHFDSITKRIASRRGILAGSLGFTAATVATQTMAQEATPGASPVAFPDDPHSSADNSEVETEFLFVQHFASGTWSPKEGEDGMYVLTLSGSLASTTYFSDRPERIVGITPTQQFLDGLGFTPENPPNAALVAHTREGDQETLLIMLFDPVYDAEGQTLNYDAQILEDYGEHGLAHLAQQQEDYHLPETLGDGSLFIDDCVPIRYGCWKDKNDNFVGRTMVDTCWSVVEQICFPCNQPAYYCQTAFPDDCAQNSKDQFTCHGEVY